VLLLYDVHVGHRVEIAPVEFAADAVPGVGRVGVRRRGVTSVFPMMAILPWARVEKTGANGVMTAGASLGWRRGSEKCQRGRGVRAPPLRRTVREGSPLNK